MGLRFNTEAQPFCCSDSIPKAAGFSFRPTLCLQPLFNNL